VESGPGSGSSPESDAAVDDELTPKSGSRIAVTGIVADGEILDVRTVEDKQRSVGCSVVNGEDGVLRCLPPQGDVVFRDAACTDPLLRGAPSNGVCPSVAGPEYTAYAPAVACPGSKVTVLRVGPLADTPSKIFKLDPDTGACVDDQTLMFTDYYATSPSPASDWVSFERDLVKVTPELGVEMWIGQDGSRIPGTYRLLAGDVACEPLGSSGNPTANEPNHCIPSNRAHEASYYLDSACTNFVTVGQHSCDPPTISERHADTMTCTQRYFELAKAVDPASLYWRIPGELMGQSPDMAPCEQANAFFLANSSYYPIGAEIDVARYPEMRLAPEGTGRIRPWYWESGGRRLLPTPHADSVAQDAQLGKSCYAVTFADGKMRCASAIGPLDGYFFADAACTRPLYEFQGFTAAPCSPLGPTKVDWVQNGDAPEPICGGGSGVSTLRPVLREHQGSIYRRDPVQDDGHCRLFPPSEYPVAPGRTFQFYDVGDPVDPSTVFAEVTAADL
jgi:hypothetical protein